MARRRPTRAERRERTASVPDAGVYGVDAQDAGADSWTGRYVFFAETPDLARQRIRDAGFHKGQIEAEWSPRRPPPGGAPGDLGPDNAHWYRSRFDFTGWSEWERLPADYRHPRQSVAAVDPSVR